MHVKWKVLGSIMLSLIGCMVRIEGVDISTNQGKCLSDLKQNMSYRGLSALRQDKKKPFLEVVGGVQNGKVKVKVNAYDSSCVSLDIAAFFVDKDGEQVLSFSVKNTKVGKVQVKAGSPTELLQRYKKLTFNRNELSNLKAQKIKLEKASQELPDPENMRKQTEEEKAQAVAAAQKVVTDAKKAVAAAQKVVTDAKKAVTAAQTSELQEKQDLLKVASANLEKTKAINEALILLGGVNENIKKTKEEISQTPCSTMDCQVSKCLASSSPSIEQTKTHTISITNFNPNKPSGAPIFASPYFSSSDPKYKTIENISKSCYSFESLQSSEGTSLHSQAYALCNQGVLANLDELKEMAEQNTPFQGQINEILDSIEVKARTTLLKELSDLAESIKTASNRSILKSLLKKYNKKLEELDETVFEVHKKKILEYQKSSIGASSERIAELEKSIKESQGIIKEYFDQFQGDRKQVQKQLKEHLFTEDASKLRKIFLKSKYYGKYLVLSERKGAALSLEDVDKKIQKDLDKYRKKQTKWEEFASAKDGDPSAFRDSNARRKKIDKRAHKERKAYLKKVKKLEKKCLPNAVGKINKSKCNGAKKSLERLTSKYERNLDKLGEMRGEETQHYNKMRDSWELEEERRIDACYDDDGDCDSENLFPNYSFDTSEDSSSYYNNYRLQPIPLAAPPKGPIQSPLLERQPTYCVDGTVPNGRGGCVTAYQNPF